MQESSSRGREAVLEEVATGLDTNKGETKKVGAYWELEKELKYLSPEARRRFRKDSEVSYIFRVMGTLTSC